MGEVNSEKGRGSGGSRPSAAHTQQAVAKFFPPRYRNDADEEELK